jgi:hypothetical protein
MIHYQNIEKFDETNYYKISKLGIESISKIEIDFLKNYKNI